MRAHNTMKRPYLREMRAFHSWVGLFLGWILFGVLLTGSLAVFHTELDQWGLTELSFAKPIAPEQAVAQSVEYLSAHAPDARLWRITLPDERDPYLRAAYKTASGGMVEAILNSGPHPFIVRNEQLGSFFLLYHSHLLLKRTLTQIGLFLVGAAGIAMLCVCISGVWSHIKVFAEFFTFRPGKNKHRAWLDLHTVLGILPLPFHLMISYTGLIMLYWLYVPSAASVIYGNNLSTFRQEALGTYSMVLPAQKGPAAPLFSLTTLLHDAQSHWGQGAIAKIYVRDPFYKGAIVEFWHERAHQVGQQYARRVYNGATGQLILQNMPLTFVARVQSVLAGLHWVEWGGPSIRWCYALAGLMGAGSVATGLILYTQKQSRAVQNTVLVTVARKLNVCALLGFSCACLSVFWAERLLPYTWPQRNALLPVVFLGVWFASIVHAFLTPTRLGWVHQGCLFITLCGLLPLTGWYRHMSLLSACMSGHWSVVVVDVSALVIALLGCVVLYRVCRHKRVLKA